MSVCTHFELNKSQWDSLVCTNNDVLRKIPRLILFVIIDSTCNEGLLWTSTAAANSQREYYGYIDHEHYTTGYGYWLHKL